MTGISRFDQDFGAVVVELAGLSALCGVRLRDPGVVDAVLRGDELIRHANPIAFDKMRGLLVLAFTLVERSVAAQGAESTAEFVASAIAEASERRDMFG